MKRTVILAGVFTAALGSLAMCTGCTGGPRLIERANVSSEAGFDAAALVIASDLDMAATGYADRKLRQLPGERDQLTILTALGSGAPGRASVFASNSVVGWPGPLAMSTDRRFVYVIETQGEIDDDVAEVDDPYTASPGELLSVIDITDPVRPATMTTLQVCANPASVDVAPDGRWLVISCRDGERPLVIVTLDDGLPQDVRLLPLTMDEAVADPDRPGCMYARLSPDGKSLAVNIGGTAIGFVRLGGEGAPSTAAWQGQPVILKDAWFAMGRWSSDGRYYLAADTGWGPGNFDAVLNGRGRIVSIAHEPSGAHSVAAEVKTSLSPEGFDISPDGSLIAVANMERTYLPGGLPYALFGRRQHSSLSLVRFDPNTGGLEMVDGPVRFDGLLPEDIVFDDDGDMLAVLSYQEQSKTPKEGWVEFFAVRQTPGGPRLEPTGERWPLPRGAHDLMVIRAQ
ncbi:MAG: hypothetical protein GC152_16440 [Alphaproteobacteria bacterium]|nr:hypothetical protein [Alphaproteobacteria bacterium]